MKFITDYLEIQMDMTNDKANMLIIENPKTYREVIENLLASITEDNEQWIFSDSEKIMKKSAVIDVVKSIFSLDLENRKIQKAVIDNLYELAVNEEHYENTLKLMRDIEAYIYQLEWGMDCNIKASYGDFHNVLKAGVEGILLPESLLEKFNEYIKLSARLLKTRVVLLLGVREYFTQEEWEQIETTASYEQIYLLCIENSDFEGNSNKVLIDLDNCRIV